MSNTAASRKGDGCRSFQLESFCQLLTVQTEVSTNKRNKLSHYYKKLFEYT